MTRRVGHDIATAVCEECGRPVADPSPDAGSRGCVRCADRYLRSLDAEFLDNYARFGARGRLVVAEACLRQLVISDVADRKLLAMTVYEQFVAAATDFLGLYHALLNRRAVPIVKGVLGFELEVAAAMVFYNDLASKGPAEILYAFGLPQPEQVRVLASGLDARERGQVAAALAEALVDLDRVLDFQVVGEQALVSAARRLGGPMALADQTNWLSGTRLIPGQVAALALNRERSGVEVNLLNTDEGTLGAVVDGIDTMTRLTRNVIFAFVSLHGQSQFEDGFVDR